MMFRLESVDARRYRHKSKRVGWTMAALLLVFGLAFSQLLVQSFGSSFWLNALGVLLGLLATSLIFAWWRRRPDMAEVRYVTRLKQHLARVSAHLSTLRQASRQGDVRALDLLAFYHQGMAQLETLEGRTMDDDAERLAERLELRKQRQLHGLPDEVAGFDPAELDAFRRSEPRK
ncbi:DUF3087 family protein [Pistricoccus aurantiacus]|uniref:DUF3087 family protein n=1 Tax=Pistricoccus aurantiacus TaxID=1883414 RepID=UPI00363DCD3C